MDVVSWGTEVYSYTSLQTIPEIRMFFLYLHEESNPCSADYGSMQNQDSWQNIYAFIYFWESTVPYSMQVREKIVLQDIHTHWVH